MSAKKTGEIVRQRLIKSKLKISGFDWRRGAVYKVMNNHLTENLGSLWKILPYRRKIGVTYPGMTGHDGKAVGVQDQGGHRGAAARDNNEGGRDSHQGCL